MAKENTAIKFIEGSAAQAIAKANGLLGGKTIFGGVIVSDKDLSKMSTEEASEYITNAILGDPRSSDPNIVAASYNKTDGKRLENFEDDVPYYNVPMTHDELLQKRSVKDMNIPDFTKMMYSGICNASSNGDLILEAFRHYILHMKITKKGNIKLTLHNGEVVKIKVEKESKKKSK